MVGISKYGENIWNTYYFRTALVLSPHSGSPAGGLLVRGSCAKVVQYPNHLSLTLPTSCYIPPYPTACHHISYPPSISRHAHSCKAIPSTCYTAVWHSEERASLVSPLVSPLVHPLVHPLSPTSMLAPISRAYARSYARDPSEDNSAR